MDYIAPVGGGTGPPIGGGGGIIAIDAGAGDPAGPAAPIGGIPGGALGGAPEGAGPPPGAAPGGGINSWTSSGMPYCSAS
jgi:hypothetical protein